VFLLRRFWIFPGAKELVLRGLSLASSFEPVTLVPAGKSTIVTEVANGAMSFEV